MNYPEKINLPGFHPQSIHRLFFLNFLSPCIMPQKNLDNRHPYLHAETAKHCSPKAVLQPSFPFPAEFHYSSSLSSSSFPSMPRSWISFVICLPYSIDVSILNNTSGTCLSLICFPISLLIKPLALLNAASTSSFSSSEASLLLVNPSTLTYAVA